MGKLSGCGQALARSCTGTPCAHILQQVVDAALVQSVINVLHLRQPHAPVVNDVSMSAITKYLVQCLVSAEMIGAAHTRNPLDINTIISCMSSVLPLFARCELDLRLCMMVLVWLLK